ncbi:hypothetical protein K435DRAFT_263447 [Dendrothele bispora CBS 962.96]|uniref:Uncharacterized protein n=1 Tax=Dendrothele bispora (strain CBS 962.96) TaxID=1314807 RepID=A0A4S8MWD4_DENBC|nr:hypothetical protein K435DRAFT_263447 [Dendrothele bispora CBS 962.96]
MPVTPRPRARHVRKEPYLPSFQLVLEEAFIRQNDHIQHPYIERWPSYVFRTCKRSRFVDLEDDDNRIYYGESRDDQRERDHEMESASATIPTSGSTISGFLCSMKRHLKSIPEVLKSISRRH